MLIHNPIKTTPFSITLMLDKTLAAELVHGDPAELWPGVAFESTPLDKDYESIYFIKVKGRELGGQPHTFDTLIVTEWRMARSRGFIHRLDVADLPNVLINDFSMQRMRNTENELKEERDAVRHLL